jgi:hypothetical protein
LLEQRAELLLVVLADGLARVAPARSLRGLASVIAISCRRTLAR